MFTPPRLPLLLFMLVFSQTSMAQPTDVQNVLDQLIRSYGGEYNLRKLDNMIQEWDLVALMGNRRGTDTRSVQTPGRLRVDLVYPGKSETRILDGDMAYVIFDGVTREDVSVPQRDAMRLQLMRLYSPLVLRDKIDSLSLKDEGDLLALSLVENGAHVHYLVNKKNWRIEKVAGMLLINGLEMKFLTEYSEFAVVEGVLVHQRENKFAGEVNTAVLQLRQITLGARLEDNIFRP